MNDLSKVVSHSYLNRNEIIKSTDCHCFYCGVRISMADLLWTDSNDPDDEEPGAIRSDRGETAVCPNCENATVLGSASGITVTDELMKAAREYWFGTSKV